MTNVPVSAQTLVFRYAYITQQQPDKVDFHIIDPVTSSVNDLFSLSIPVNYLISGGEASLDGKSIAWLLYNKGTGQTSIQIVDSLTGQTRNVADVQKLDEINTLLGPEYLFLWSPNSQYLAFNTIQSNGLSVLEVYTLSNGNISSLVTPTNAYQFAWSDDSTKLAVAGGDCFASCVVFLDTFNITTGQHESSANLRDVAREAASHSRAALCDLNWSPDNLFLSFMMNCDSSFIYDREIHVWDVTHGTDMQLTNFTTLLANSQPVSEIHVNYKPFWYDAQTLLVGMNLRVFVNRKGGLPQVA
jgi:WD40 repeat protein